MSSSLNTIRFMLDNEPHLKSEVRKLVTEEPKKKRLTKKEREAKRFEGCYTSLSQLV